MPDRTVEIPDSVKAEAAGELARMLCGCGDTELKPNPSTVAVAEDAVDLVAPILAAQQPETYTREEVERRLLSATVDASMLARYGRHFDWREVVDRALAAAFPESQPTQDQKDGEN